MAMKVARHRVALGLCSGLLLGAAPIPAALAQQDGAVAQLVQQAEFWDAKQRPDLARESWKRVLAADPRNARALARLAVLEEQNGNAGDSRRYLDTLRQVAPDSPELRRAQQELLSGGAPATLARARALGQQGKAADAVAAYEQAFGGSTPPDDVTALEYYETMAGIERRYAEARDALATLAQRNAGDTRYALTYARVLTYRAASRREGIQRLRTLAGDPKYGADARRAWRQALVWLQATSADQPLYQAYLDGVGRDAEIADKLDALKQARAGAVIAQAGQAADAELAHGFRALDDGELAVAEATFERLIGRNTGNVADARAGLALVRLRQQRFAEAGGLFDAAIRAKPGLEPRYREARRTATFWGRVRRAEQAAADGDTRQAETDYASALAAPPPGGAPASVVRAYADALVANDKATLAEQKLREALKAHPNQPELVSGLAGVLIRSHRNDEANRLLANAPEASRIEFRTAQAEISREQAAALVQAGRNAEAEQKLREALVAAPESPWVRLDLARLYRRMGRDAEAESLLNAMVEAASNTAQARLAQAYAYAESQRWYEALQALEQLAPADRNADARKLQHEAWVRYQVQRATQAAQRGDASHAAEWLGAAVDGAGNDPALASALAQGWAALGDPARAVAVLRRSFASRGEPSAGDRIQYAALLLQIDQDAEFEAVSTTLIQRGGLTPAQSRTLEDLIVGYRIKLADRARERGDFGTAYKQLREVVARYPDQPRVQMALARLFTSAGEPDKALAIGRALMKSAEPSDEQLYAAIDAALAAQDRDSAARWIDLAFQRGNDPVAAHRAAARLAEQRGRQAEALGHYREAELLAQKQDAYGAQPPDLTLIDPASGDARLLPEPLRDMLRGEDVPVGPLLPRAPDAGSEAVLPATPALPAAERGAAPTPAAVPPADARYAGYRLDAKLQGGSGRELASASSSRYGAPLALQFERRLRTPAPDSEWVAPYDETQVKPIDRLEAQVSGWALGGFMSRSRNGESGLGQLYDLETPIDWTSRQWRAGRIGLRVRPVYLDASTVSGDNLLKFGTLALINGDSQELDQSDSGIALAAAWQIADFSADLGTTPVGFSIENLVGGLQWAPQFGELSLKFDVSRRAVTDSLLSYAGAYDPLTGHDWGGVTRTGGRFDAAYDFGRYGLYGNGGYSVYTGRNVDENSEYEIGGGLFIRAYQRGSQTLTVGLNLTALGFDKNLRYFSFGHGGYFSPQYFGAVTVPISFTGTYGALSYRAELALGLQSFREDGAALYPNNGALQKEVEDLAASEPASNLATGYASQNNSGLAYRVGSAVQYRMTERLSLGGTLSVDNARDYEELVLLGYLRWYFSGVQPLPPEPNAPNVFKGPLP
ncbi:cellulose biosynthesis protein BcsC [Solimonas flava]|uniref:cellulose biosynthesis protein BcsC n=1 Tax=Solimonas flava TaxID=415849 RepID=UPI00040D8129|nr:cellulose biosynthesis protein BcsC [Solimonas flava]